MNMKLTKFLISALLIGAMSVVMPSCGGSDDNPSTGGGSTTTTTGQFNPQVDVPTALEITDGSGKLALKVKGSVLKTDNMYLEDGTMKKCTVTNVDDENIYFTIPSNVTEGSYRVIFERNGQRKTVGTTQVVFVEAGFTPQAGTTVYGYVRCDGEGVADVVVSDGVECTKTNAQGQYELRSDKQMKYVFMSVPSGYEPTTSGVFPQIYAALNQSASTPEIHSFQLTKVNGQDNHKILYFGDMHLANRNDDIKQFKQFTADVNNWVSSHSSEKVYAITLGDMTWDLYWYDNKFEFSNYRNLINEEIKNLTIYHTIGNHDNDYKTTNNTDAKKPWCVNMAPLYYSFNIGKIHYMIIDDIDCTTYDGTTSRNYKETVYGQQLAWIKKDLSYVSASTPVVICLHAPVFDVSGHSFKNGLTNTPQLLSAVSGYNVTFISGHTHKMFNVLSSETVTQGKTVTEKNVGAVCSDWWWSGHETPGCLTAQDGAPSGYEIANVVGTNTSYIYKAVHAPETDYRSQFRSYDLNNVSFSAADVPGTSGDALTEWNKRCAQYPQNTNNEVLINVWNYNKNWTITVTTEGGKTLSTTLVQAYDPLHILAMDKPRFKGKSSSPNFITSNYTHFFKVQCPNATDDLTITVKDEYGNSWTENMARPKAFTTATYQLK